MNALYAAGCIARHAGIKWKKPSKKVKGYFVSFFKK